MVDAKRLNQVKTEEQMKAELTLAAMMRAGLESGEPVLADDAFWKDKQKALKERQVAKLGDSYF